MNSTQKSKMLIPSNFPTTIYLNCKLYNEQRKTTFQNSNLQLYNSRTHGGFWTSSQFIFFFPVLAWFSLVHELKVHAHAMTWYGFCFQDIKFDALLTRKLLIFSLKTNNVLHFWKHSLLFSIWRRNISDIHGKIHTSEKMEEEKKRQFYHLGLLLF